MALVNYEKKDKIVTITMNSPDRLNALSREVLVELSNAWRTYTGDPEARVAVLTGTGKAFCAGHDIHEMIEQGPGAYARQIGASGADGIGGMTQVEKPIITAINGRAMGGGCLIVLASDIRIATEKAAIGLVEITLGAYGSVDWLIAQGIPFCIAMELVLTGEPITAQRAYEVGLVNKVVPDEEVMPTAIKVAERIAELSPLAVKLNKRAGVKAAELGREALDEKQKIFSELMDSEDSQEGARAFMERRNPVFKGR